MIDAGVEVRFPLRFWLNRFFTPCWLIRLNQVHARIAQLVEPRIHTPEVGGSSPPIGTKYRFLTYFHFLSYSPGHDFITAPYIALVEQG